MSTSNSSYWRHRCPAKINRRHCLFAQAVVLLSAVQAAAAPATDEPPAAALLPTRAFAQLPVMSHPRISPDGSRLAYLFPQQGRNHLAIRTLNDAKDRVALPPGDDYDFEWLHWANDERLVFLVSYTGKRQRALTHETRLASVGRDGTDVQWIIRPPRSGRTEGSLTIRTAAEPPQLQGNVIDWLVADPHNILVSLDEDFDGDAEVRRVDVRDGAYKVVKLGGRGVHRWAADAKGKVRLGFSHANDSDNARIQRPNGKWITAARSDWWQSGSRPLAFTDDPSQLFVLGPNEKGLDVVRIVDVDGGHFVSTVFENPLLDAQGLAVDGVSGRPVGVSYVDDLPRVHYFDKTYRGLQRSVEKVHAGMAVHIVDMSRDRRHVLVNVLSSTDPGVYYHWNRDTKRMDAIQEVMPGLHPEAMSPVTAVSYTARDGAVLPGYLIRPRGRAAGQLPAIVLPHGETAGRSSARFWYLSQFLAARGYTVLMPNYRGSKGYGARHFEAGANRWGGKIQEDIVDAAKWLVEKGIADANRISIVGWSFGGYAAALAIAETPELFRCAVSINAPLDLLLLQQDLKRRDGPHPWSQAVAADTSTLVERSPYHRAERIARPLLVVQSRDDVLVNVQHGERMATRLRELDKPVEFVDVALGGHALDNEPARTAVLEALERFLASHSGG